MKVSCPSCQTTYNIDDKRIPPGGAKLKCARCQNTFPIKPGEVSAAPDAVPLPSAAPPAPPASGAVPLPGRGSSQATVTQAVPLPGGGSSQATVTQAVPLPSAAPPATATQAVPLPGASSYSDYDDEPRQEADATRVVAMPVPNAAFREEATSPAAPAYGTAQPMATERDFDFGGGGGDTGSLELGAPGAFGGQPAPAVEEYDPFANGPPPDMDAVPLPGGAPAQSSYVGTERDLDLSGQEAVPMPAPGGSYEADPFGTQAGADPFGTQDLGYGDPGAPAEADPFAMPPPPQAPEAPDPFGGADPFAMPPPEPAQAADPFASEADPFAMPEQPPAAAPSRGAAPAAAGSDFNFDFADVPQDPDAPAQAPAAVPDFNFDFAEPPPAAAAPPPSAAPGGMPNLDALEFDPTSPPKPAAPDEFEADLSAPMPPPPAAGNADGLEMLSFIDDTAKQEGGSKPSASKGRKFHVRRRSGKVFGPFEEGVIVKMLEDGQLLGNEDVSTDADTWTPIGTVNVFAAAIQKLMEGPANKSSPSIPVPTVGGDPTRSAENPAASMDRLKQLYEGRMAAVAVVDTQSKLEKYRKYLPHALAAAGVLVVLSIGLSFGFTRYGVFGHKKFFPSRVSSSNPAYAQVESARKELLQDTFQSYKQARDLSSQVLAGKEYPEVRALWCQAVYYLQRRYSAAEPAEIERCRLALEEDIELLGEKNVEALKAYAGQALVERRPDAVLARLQDVRSREANADDLELAFLIAESLASKGQQDQAISTLKQVLQKHPESAKAHHALGSLYKAANKADEAAKAYEAALKADPSHVISAVELAAVEVEVRKDAQKGLELVEGALEEKRRAEMGPAEVARALALKGSALSRQFKHQEAEAVLREALKADPRSTITKGYLGDVLRKQRKYSEALPLFKAAFEAEPKNIDYRDGYITLLVYTGNMQEATTAVEKANQDFPNNARIAYLYGRIDEARDKPTEAEAHYKRSLAADDKFYQANLSLGRFYLRQRKVSEAREQLEKAREKAPDEAIVRSGLGELALAQNDPQRAQEEFERAVKLDPSLADAHLGLSRLYLQAGNLERAQEEVDKALELAPVMLKDGRLQRGMVLKRLGRLDEAVAELEKAKQEDPTSVSAPITLGAVQLERGELKEAETNLLLALRREPSNTEALFNLALVKAKSAEYTQAIDNMKSAVDRAPKRADLRYYFGVIYREAKRSGDALEQWKIAVELDPSYADAHEALGQAWLEQGNYDKAIASFNAVLKADPSRMRVRGLIGDAHFSAGRWKQAIDSYEVALKANPGLTYLYYKIGRALSEQGQHNKAIAWYLKATKSDAQNAMPHYYLGYAYKERGKRKDAVASFRRYLELKPDAEDKRDIEDEIYDLEQR